MTKSGKPSERKSMKIPPKSKHAGLFRKINAIIDREGVRTEVEKWIAAFGDDPERISPARLAQHLKASVTGKSLNKEAHVHGMRVCDEVNALLGKTRRNKRTLNRKEHHHS